MKVFLKRKNRKKHITEEQFEIINCSENLNFLIESENRRHKDSLITFVDIIVEEYGLTLLCLLITNNIRILYDECVFPFDDEILDWAYSYSKIDNLPLKINNTIIDEKHFTVDSCLPIDLEFIAKICIKKLEEEKCRETS